MGNMIIIYHKTSSTQPIIPQHKNVTFLEEQLFHECINNISIH